VASRRRDPAFFLGIASYEPAIPLTIPAGTSFRAIIEKIASQHKIPVASLPKELEVRTCAKEMTFCITNFSTKIDQIVQANNDLNLEWGLDDDGLYIERIGTQPSAARDKNRKRSITAAAFEKGKLIDSYTEQLSKIGVHCQGRRNVTENFCRKKCSAEEFTIWEAIDDSLNSNFRKDWEEKRKDFFEGRRPDRATPAERDQFLADLLQLKTGERVKKLREAYRAAAGKQGLPRGRAAKKL